jgi:uncharacterized protein YfaS (alpha-2-macroglobulin family)
MRQNRWILMWALLAILGGVVGHRLEAREPQDTLVEPAQIPLEITLKDGGAGATGDPDPTAKASGVALAQARAAEILKMFTEPLQTMKDRPEFFKRPASQPAPRSATPVKLPFPPPQGSGAPDVKADALKVLSITPQGATERAPRLAISFNNPMIAVTAASEALPLRSPGAAESGNPLGITLEPRPEGAWRWLGTQTVIFEPAGGEFPRATEYKVTIPAGASDAKGNSLAEASTAAFVLPRPKVTGSSPKGGGHQLEPLITVTFDQPVVRESALAKIDLRKGSDTVAIRNLTLAQAEVRQPGLEASYKDARKDTVFWFAPQQALTPGTTYTLSVEAGVQSQEGPRASEAPYSASFATYDALKLVDIFPDPEDKPSPFLPFTLNFNNSLDRKSFEPGFVTVKPEIPDLKVRISGNSMMLEGPKQGMTTYQVTVSGKLTDTFGQKLGDPVTAKFITDRAPKALFSGFESMTVVDPTVAASLPLYSTNIDKLTMVVHKVEPQDWSAYQRFIQERWRAADDTDRPKLPGTQLKKTSISLKGQSDQLVVNQVDLSEYLEGGQGNLIIWLTDPSEDKETYRQREILTWVQGTKLGLDLEVSHDQAVALVTHLRDGKPVPGAQVNIGSASSVTEKDGTTTLSLPDTGSDHALVKAGSDRAFLPRSLSPYGASWAKQSLSSQARWFLFDDRGLYKPGETAHIKGYARQWTRGPQGQLTKAGEAGSEVNWVLNDPRGNKVGEGKTTLSAFGTVDFTVALPKDTNLGSHYLSLSGAATPSGSHSINVQEFRRPEFEVTTEVISEQPHLLQGSATVKASAVYYAGGSLAGAEVDWQVSASGGSYTPPGRGDFTFGRWTPWWNMGPWWRTPSNPGSYQSFQGRADSEGEHSLELGFVRMYPPQPTTVTATASVADVNRQQRSGSSTLLVHPSSRYVGLKTEKSFVDDKSGFVLDAIVTDIDGNMLPGVPISVTLLEVGYDYDDNGDYRELEKIAQQLTVRSAEAPVKIELSPPRGGTYRIRAEVTDAEGRLNRTDYTMWKAGGMLPSKDKVELETLTMVPDRKEYVPGQTAAILVMAPFAEGEGMVVWSRDGLVKKERFSLDNGSATLSYPLTEEMIPNLHARVTVVGKAPWGKRERPAVAGGALNLAISKASRTLTVEVLPVDAKLEPGAEVELQALVKDDQGRPVSGSEVTLWMADEAVLGLVGYDLPRPLPSFYSDRPAGFEAFHLRTAVALGAPDLKDIGSDEELSTGERSRNEGVLRGMAKSAPPPPSPMATMAPMAEAAPAEADALGQNTTPASTFTVRKNFDALAVFKGALLTDAAGTTRVKVKLPDNLTRYRIFSVAIKDDNRFGSGDQILTARLPVMVRPSLPRFLNFGDRAKLPVVVQNQTSKPVEVEVVGEATGVAWVGPVGQKVTVPANDRVEVSFEAQADQVGIAHFRFGAITAGGRTDAATLSLPVYTPASGEAFATYGSIADKEGAIAQPVKRPSDIWTQFGGLQVSLSSTALSELTDAFLYLYVYPYECAEQKASRVLSIAALRDVLAAFNAEGLPDAKTIESRMAEDLNYLVRLQNSDGGWQYWRREDRSVPFVSLHVAHAIVRAKISGYKVDENSLQRAMGYLKQIEAKCRALDYGPEITRSLTAYAVYLRNLNGDSDLAKAKALLAELKGEKNLNLEALGWIWPTLTEKAKGSPEAAELRRLVINRATETADKAQFTMSYGEGDGQYLLLHSNQRTDAILLYALLGDDPANALNTKLVRGLLAQRKKGHWQSTQENVWVLLALQKYFRTFEKEAPDFIARVWLESAYLGEQAFKGRSNVEAQIEVPMTSVPEKQGDLIIGKSGPGRLYYRVGMTYAPKSLRLPAESRGFTVERKFRGLDNPTDVSQNEQGDWFVKAGAKVEVELSMVVTERRYHVALVDPLPAGLEPLNPALLGTPPVSTGGDVDGSVSWWRWWRWYEHENLRDERAEVFASLLYPGVYTYRYTALATTPGEFVLPPTKAEEMYSPEVFGRTATGRLTVK